jgi:signal transduction histidine kinase
LLSLSIAWAAQPPSAPDLHFQEAEFVASASGTPPQDGWRPQRLPDSWLHNHPGLSGFGWYRMQFKLDAVPTHATALYVSRLSTTGQFWLNGSVLNPQVRFTTPGGPIGNNMSRWPTLITLPGGLLRAGDNVLHIRVQGFITGGHGLGDVRIGSVERLRSPWLAREIPQRIIPEGLFALMLAGSVFGLLVWWRERRARNLHFAAATALWTAVVGMWVLPEPPLTPEGVSLLLITLYNVFFWLLLHLFYRYSESDWHWYPRMLNWVFGFTLAAALGIIAFTANTEGAPQSMGLVMLPSVLMRLLATVMLLHAAWRKRSPRTFALAATEVLWFAGHLQIIGIMAGWLPPGPFRFDPASSLPLYLVMLYFFVERLVQEREQAARDQQAAIIAERARILQDMHDGLGSQLVTALRLVKREDGDRAVAARNIEEALQDLRLIIDSLDDTNQGLLPMLGDLRHRLEPRLAELGIRLHWDVQPLPEFAGLQPQSALNTMRVVQEALNNAVKHARPTVIKVSITRQDGAAVVGVADDGSGFDPEALKSAGRGLSGMRKRAEQIGASLRVERHDGGGTTVSLHFPPPSGLRPKVGAAA